MAQFTCGPLEYRTTQLAKKGDACPGHTHNFDHVTQVVKGSVRVTVTYEDDRLPVDALLTAPDFFLVEAQGFHTITALEDNTEFWCVYPHRKENGEISLFRTGFEKAYQ